MSRSRDVADQINRVNSSAADATAITIDSSENVLVGKSASGLANAGIELTASNILRTTKASSASAEFNRTGTDGDIAIFWKDTVPVGSIGTSGGLFNIGSGDTGLLFAPASDIIIPSNPTNTANGGRDAAIDLGNVYNRFKDLYLSGGVYLGGTGAANALDDYEEGTWTPTFANIGTGTYSHQIGRYTKIGNRVFAEFHLDIALIGNASGELIINGLPFLSVNVASNYGSMTTAHAGGWTGDFANLGGLVGVNVTNMRVFYQNTSGATSNATHADMQVGNFLGTIIYEAA